MKKEIEAADAVLIVSPEVPAVLKNAIDWAPRQELLGRQARRDHRRLDRPDRYCGRRSHLRTILSPLKVLLMGQPEAYIQLKPGMIDDAMRQRRGFT